jgi:hypothetical protein
MATREGAPIGRRETRSGLDKLDINILIKIKELVILAYKTDYLSVEHIKI